VVFKDIGSERSCHGPWAMWMFGVFSRSWMELLVGSWWAHLQTNERASPLVRSVQSLLSAAVLLQRFVMSGRPRRLRLRT
jgi:hypothetical protein